MLVDLGEMLRRALTDPSLTHLQSRALDIYNRADGRITSALRIVHPFKSVADAIIMRKDIVHPRATVDELMAVAGGDLDSEGTFIDPDVLAQIASSMEVVSQKGERRRRFVLNG